VKSERGLPIAGSFRDLRVYQLARAASAQIFAVSKSFPREERFALTDQIPRSARATKAMISEAWARRRYRAVFVNKLDEAQREANETRSWLDDALDCGYLEAEKFQKMERDWLSIASMLARMIDRASDFCKYASHTDFGRWNQRMTVDEHGFAFSGVAALPFTFHFSPFTWGSRVFQRPPPLPSSNCPKFLAFLNQLFPCRH
jgi:four helix bundle protein